MRIGMQEGQFRMSLPGALDHGVGKIDACSVRGLQRCQEIALRATDLDDSLARRDEVFKDLRQPLVIVTVAGSPPFDVRGYKVPKMDAAIAIRLLSHCRSVPRERLCRRGTALRATWSAATIRANSCG